MALRREISSDNALSKSYVKNLLGEGVIVYESTFTSPLLIEFAAACSKFSNIILTIDWSKASKNVLFQPSLELLAFRITNPATEISSLKVKVKVLAFTTLFLGSMQIIDASKPYSIMPNFTFQEEKPDEAEIARCLEIHRREIIRKTLEMQSLYGSILANTPNLPITTETMKEVFAQYGKSFLDVLFLPSQHSIFHSPTHMAKMEHGKTYEEILTAVWKRPIEFIKNGPIQVFQDGIESADIIQGRLGNCWFLSALAALAEIPELITALFPLNARSYSPGGMYEVRFCKNGLWQTVCVDDYFPCFPCGGPLFSRSNGNELWVLLVEKAYAKLHRSYLAIQSGKAIDALADLTGAPVKAINFPSIEEENSSEKDHRIENIWRQLLEGANNGYLMSAGTRSRSELEVATTSAAGGLQRSFSVRSIGLVLNHAYTILRVIQTSCGDRLIKLRNPWGSMEWTGDWSDSSDKWTAEMKAEVENIKTADDGVFWMSINDFVYYFSDVNVCMIRVPTLNSPTPWYNHRRPFSIELSPSTVSEELVTSPFFRIELSEHCRLIFTIHQRDTRSPNVPIYIDVGYVLLRVLPSGRYEFVDGKKWLWKKRLQSKEVDLDAGVYLFVPMSTGHILRQFRKAVQSSSNFDSHIVNFEERENIFIELPIPSNDNSCGNTSVESSASIRRNLQLSQTATNIYTDIFHRLDSDCNGYLSKLEIERFLLKATGSSLNHVTYNYLVQHFEHSHEGRPKLGLTLNGFLRGQAHLFNQILSKNGNNIKIAEEAFYKEIEAFGYDRHTYHWSNGRSMVFSLHSSHKNFKVSSVPYDPTLANLAQELFICKKGKRTDYRNKCAVYVLNTGCEGASVVAENLQVTKELDITIEFTGSNIVSSRSNGSLKHQCVIPPQGKHLMFHILPNNVNETWSSAYTVNC